MGIRIPDLLEGILEATADEQAAKARIALIRATLEAEAHRRYIADKAAPSWNAPQLGKVRLDPAGVWTATVADPEAFGSYVAQHYPTEATASIQINAADLPDALTALEFVGITPTGARVGVRSAWASTYLEGLAVDVEETTDADGAVDRTTTVVDTATGVLVDGLSATRSPAKLVVTLDRNRRAAAIGIAKATAEELVTKATTEDGEQPDPEAIRARRIELEGLTAAELTALAKRLELGASGTKAELAERIARLEATRPATPPRGRTVTLDEAIAAGIVRPASELSPTERATVERFEQAPDALTTEPTDVDPDEDVEGCLSAYVDPDEDTPEAAAFRATEALYVASATGGKVAAIAELERLGGGIGDEGILPGDELTIAEPSLDPVAAGRLDGLSREVLRSYARTKGISPGGTKGQLIERLVAAGTSVLDVNDHAQAARTA